MQYRLKKLEEEFQREVFKWVLSQVK
jgi:hypothetical protein